MSAPEPGRIDPRDLALLADLVAARLGPLARPSADRLLTVAAVADRLAMSEEWVRDHRGLLGGFRVGPGERAPLRFRPADVESYVASRSESERPVREESQDPSGIPEERCRPGQGTGLDRVPVSSLKPRSLPKKVAGRRDNAPGPTTGVSAPPRTKRTRGGARSVGAARPREESSR